MIKDLSTNQEETIIGENVQVSGNLQTSSDIQINGKVRGEVHSKGTIVIGKTAVVEGPISAVQVKVEGTVRGNITTEELLELESTAQVFGDIETKTLAIQPGAVFVGKSTMGKEEEKEEKKAEPELEVE
jgi:cytoskeletal protein CcmA (bactofilin family)